MVLDDIDELIRLTPEVLELLLLGVRVTRVKVLELLLLGVRG